MITKKLIGLALSVFSISASAQTSCQAAFTAYTDTNCVTHFVNTSTGSSLSYQWYDMNGFSLLSTSANPNLNLANGTYTISLYNYSGGAWCDSVTQIITVGCGTGTTTSGCTAGFTSYTDSSCVTHFVNSSTGTGLSYEWYDMNGFSLLSTSANPNLNLANGTYTISLYNYSGGAWCDSVTKVITVACGSGTTSPTGCVANASFAIFGDSTNTGTYYAYNTSSGTGSLGYLWDFGDGTTSTQQYPFHNYSVPGNYIVCLTVTANNGTTTCIDTHCDSSSVTLRMASGFVMSQINVIAQSTTGIKQNESLAGIAAYPNPISDELTIEISENNKSKLSYSIIDALGRIVLTGQLENSKTTINTGNLVKGFYNLNISNCHNAKTNIKLVK